MNAPVDVLASVNVTPKLVAELFWGLDNDAMTDFFAELERMAGINLCFQMSYVIHEITERAERGDHEALNGFQTMLSHAQHYAEDAASWRAARAKAEIAALARVGGAS